MRIPFDPEYPYALYLNGELLSEYSFLDDENIDLLGSEERAHNEIEVYYKGTRVHSMTTSHGKIVAEWVAEGYDPASSLSQSREDGNG